MSLTLYLEAKTSIPDLFIDYIEVRLTSGESASLNWDESEIYRNPDGFGAKYKGVYFGEEPANGRLDELRDMVITGIGLYSDTEAAIEPMAIFFCRAFFFCSASSTVFREDNCFSYSSKRSELRAESFFFWRSFSISFSKSAMLFGFLEKRLI